MIDRCGIAEMPDWKNSHTALDAAISAMSWPKNSRSDFTIPRIVTIKKGDTYIAQDGETRTWKKEKPKTLRNGVVPLRQRFRENLERSGWKAEEPLSLTDYFERTRADQQLAKIFRYPAESADAILDPLHEGVGHFDFWLRSTTGFGTVVEWETGNISSSHRSLNKMCLALMGGVVDAAVLVVPSNLLSPHLTDRIGNVRELQPYFYFWSRIGQLISRGLLAIIEVEQDHLFSSKDIRDFVPTGTDGNALRSKGSRKGAR